MPVDSIGQTFRFIVEQAAGGGGGGGGGAPPGAGGGGGGGGRSVREGNEFRNMMQKMVKAVDRSEKTTTNAFQAGFKKLGLQITFANLLKQSQVFTGTLNAIFQVIGALVDITLTPFLPLIVEFLQTSIPKLVATAEKMATWTKGQLAQLDELGIVGYIKKKLETDIPAALVDFGPTLASGFKIATTFMITTIPSLMSSVFKMLGPILSVVVNAGVTNLGQLLTGALGDTIKWVTDLLAGFLEMIAETEIAGIKPFAWLGEMAKGLRETGQGAHDALDKAGEAFGGVGQAMGEMTEELFSGAAAYMGSPEVQKWFDDLAVSSGLAVEVGVNSLNDGMIEMLKAIGHFLPEKKEIPTPEETAALLGGRGIKGTPLPPKGGTDSYYYDEMGFIRAGHQDTTKKHQFAFSGLGGSFTSGAGMDALRRAQGYDPMGGGDTRFHQRREEMLGENLTMIRDFLGQDKAPTRWDLMSADSKQSWESMIETYQGTEKGAVIEGTNLVKRGEKVGEPGNLFSWLLEKATDFAGGVRGDLGYYDPDAGGKKPGSWAQPWDKTDRTMWPYFDPSTVGEYTGTNWREAQKHGGTFYPTDSLGNRIDPSGNQIEVQLDVTLNGVPDTNDVADVSKTNNKKHKVTVDLPNATGNWSGYETGYFGFV